MVAPVVLQITVKTWLKIATRIAPATRMMTSLMFLEHTASATRALVLHIRIVFENLLSITASLNARIRLGSPKMVRAAIKVMILTRSLMRSPNRSKNGQRDTRRHLVQNTVHLPSFSFIQASGPMSWKVLKRGIVWSLQHRLASRIRKTEKELQIV